MAAWSRTKYLLARVLRDQMKDEPFSQIKVADICERAGITKQAFYYHFKDKYDLAAWAFLQSAPAIPAGEAYTPEAAKLQYEYFLTDKDFYWNLYRDPAEYNMFEYLCQYTEQALCSVLMAYRKADALPDEDRWWIHYHSYGVNRMLRDWILGNIGMTPEQFGQFQYDCFSEEFRRALSIYGVRSAGR